MCVNSLHYYNNYYSCLVIIVFVLRMSLPTYNNTTRIRRASSAPQLNSNNNNYHSMSINGDPNQNYNHSTGGKSSGSSSISWRNSCNSCAFSTCVPSSPTIFFVRASIISWKNVLISFLACNFRVSCLVSSVWWWNVDGNSPGKILSATGSNNSAKGMMIKRRWNYFEKIYYCFFIFLFACSLFSWNSWYGKSW